MPMGTQLPTILSTVITFAGIVALPFIAAAIFFYVTDKKGATK